MTTQTVENPIPQIQLRLRRDQLWRLCLELQADRAALQEDNRQLRAALRIFSEVARNSPASLPLRQKAVA